MKRKQLIELHEYQYTPTFMRRLITEFLARILTKFSIYQPCLPILSDLIKKNRITQIVDFCSGSGGDILNLHQALKKEYQIDIPLTLTDLYPDKNTINRINKKNNVYYPLESINALNYTIAKPSLRTFFTSFHHFTPEQAKQILQNSVDHNDPIAIFEFTENSKKRLLQDILTPLFVLLLMPSVKQLKWPRYLLTYLLPIAPLFITWDAIVSNLRTYSTSELKALAYSVEKKHYVWNTGTLKSGLRFYNLTYLIGYPKHD